MKLGLVCVTAANGLRTFKLDFRRQEYLTHTNTGRNEVKPDELADDILFSPRQMAGMSRAGIDTNLFRMDHVVKNANWRGSSDHEALFQIWDIPNPSGSGIIVPYRFHTNYPESGRTKIRVAIAALQQELGDCITFLDDTDTETYTSHYVNVTCDLEIGGQQAGCLSSIGMTGASQLMNLAASSDGCGAKDCLITGTIQHEFMHALGFAHEHSRPDRDTFVRINQENIIPTAYDANFSPVGHSDWFDMNSRYDYGSVMHYSSRAFITDEANSAGLYTIEALQTSNPYIQGQRTRASTHDILQITSIYSSVCTTPDVASCDDNLYSVLPSRICDGFTKDCHDQSDEGVNCICNYNNGNGCCTGTIQVDLGSVVGVFDYQGWDDVYDRPWYKTTIGATDYVMFYWQNQGAPERCQEVGTGMWAIVRGSTKPACQAVYSASHVVQPQISENMCPDGISFGAGYAAAVCTDNPICAGCTDFGTCAGNGAAAAGDVCGDASLNLVCGSSGVCCECAAGKANYDGDASNGCEADITTTTAAPTTTAQALDTCDNVMPRNGRTCSDFQTCEVIRKNQVYGRKIQDLTGRIQGVSANMLEERHEVSCPAGKFYPSNGNQAPSGFVNVTCLCTETDGCKWTYANPGWACLDVDYATACPTQAIEWVGNLGRGAHNAFSQSWSGTAGTVSGEYGGFLKAAFKPGKFVDPTLFSSGVVFFLVWPMHLRYFRVNGMEIKARLYAGDDSQQLAMVEDDDSTMIVLSAVNGIGTRITSGQYTHFWFTLNGVNMTSAQLGDFRMGAIAKSNYDAILADSNTIASTDLEYANCLIGSVSKVPPYAWPQNPSGR